MVVPVNVAPKPQPERTQTTKTLRPGPKRDSVNSLGSRYRRAETMQFIEMTQKFH